jgi:hypothetical protein
VIDKEKLKFKELEHVLIEKVEQLFYGHALARGFLRILLAVAGKAHPCDAVFF